MTTALTSAPRPESSLMKAYRACCRSGRVHVEDVNLSGLSLRLDGYHIKMWKASEDGLPVPGKSEPKQAFYQQPLFTDGDRPEILHLAVIWNTDASRNLSSVWLVCPKFGDEKSAEEYWNIRIPD